MKLQAAVLACSLSLVTGCHLYFGDDDPIPPCDFGGGADIAFDGQINPESGQCEYFGGGCNSECGPCAETDQALPSWAFCNTECTGLGEAQCLDTSGCRAIYEGDGGLFEACWGTDQTGPVQGGDCSSFESYECSRHDDCVAVHVSCAGSGNLEEAPGCELGAFVNCDFEPGGGGPGSCYGEVSCDSEPPECPPSTMPGILDGCWSGFCIPLEDCEGAPACGDIGVEATCIARTDCSPRYRGIDCTCVGDACTCADWLFTQCSE